jgi:hypothetical protein
MMSGYLPLSTHTILRHIMELCLITGPIRCILLFIQCHYLVDIDGWSDHNLKGFYVVNSLDRHCHDQVEELTADHHRCYEWTWH